MRLILIALLFVLAPRSWGVTASSRIVVNSVTALRSLAPGQYAAVELAGYYTAGDGGGGSLYWSASSSAAADSCEVYKPFTSPTKGRWIRNKTNVINIKGCGAKGDGVHDDANNIQAASDLYISPTVNDAFVQFYSAAADTLPITQKIFFPKGSYLISKTINLQGIYNLEGAGSAVTYLKAAAVFTGTTILNNKILSGSKLWTLGGHISGFKFLGTATVAGLTTYRNHLWDIRDCVFYGCKIGFDGQGAYSGVMTNCEFQKNTKAIRYTLINDAPIFEESNAITHYACEFFSNDTALDLGGSQNLNFHGGVIQGAIQAVKTNGTVSVLNFDGVYFESNGNGSNPAIQGDILNLSVHDGFINQNSGRFINALSVVQIFIDRNEIRGGLALVDIDSLSAIVKLAYGKNRIYFSRTWTENIIRNNKASFTPDPLYLGSIPTTGISATAMIKAAFDGNRGIVNVDINWPNFVLIDFPSTWRGTSDKITMSHGGGNPVQVKSSNVELQGIRFSSSFEPALIIGDTGVAKYSNVNVKDCIFEPGGNTYPVYVSDSVQDFHFENLRFARTNNGNSIFLNGQKGFLRNIKTSNGFSAAISLQANQLNNTFVDVDGIGLVGYLPYVEIKAIQSDSNIDARTTIITPGASSNSMPRPAIGTSLVNGEVHGYRSGLQSSDDGFMRLSSGGGTTAAEKTGIDVSGYSSLSDMRGTVVVFVHGTEVTRWSYTDGMYVSAMRFQMAKGANVASANDLTLGGGGNIFTTTGTVQINRITTTGWKAGSVLTLILPASGLVADKGAATSGALARIHLSGAANFTAGANGGTCSLMYDGTDWDATAACISW